MSIRTERRMIGGEMCTITYVDGADASAYVGKGRRQEPPEKTRRQGGFGVSVPSGDPKRQSVVAELRALNVTALAQVSTAGALASLLVIRGVEDISKRTGLSFGEIKAIALEEGLMNVVLALNGTG